MRQCSKLAAWSLVLGLVLVTGQLQGQGESKTHETTASAADKTQSPQEETKTQDLPPKLRPLDIVRPTLPEDVAKEVAELEAKIAELKKLGLTAETRDAQNAALDDAIALAERVLKIRIEHQGNTSGHVRWRNGAGEVADWHELIDARGNLDHFRRLHELDAESRNELASIEGTDAEYERLETAGRYAEALAAVQNQLAIRRRVLGDEHPGTLTSIHNMGYLLKAQGKLSEAEPYYREALETGRRVLGDEHLNTLASINNMGSLLYVQGKLSEVEPYYREALQTCRRVLGDEHPRTLASINNMGSLLQVQGKLSEAEPYCREALQTSRRVLGDEHPDTLTSINNMGSLLSAQGKLSEAEPYDREALQTSRRVLGDEHPGTLTSIHNMGGLLSAQGKLSEAEPYYREALETGRRVLGDEHLNTLASINNMGGLLQAQGKLSEAEPYCREALQTSRRVLGDEHPGTLASINNMGGLLSAQGKLSEAEPYYREALETCRRVLGDEHPSTLASINSMGSLLQVQGKLSEAEPYYREALQTSRRVLGDVHPDTLTSINYMGGLLSAQGKLSEADPYYREALQTSRRVLGDEHPSTLTFINNMGSLLQVQRKLSEAEPYCREALQTSRRILGDEHRATLTYNNNMGQLLQTQGKLSEAEPYCREALQTGRRVLGDEHPSTLAFINNMGGLLEGQGKLSEADPYYREALQTGRRVLGDEHARTLIFISNMGRLLQAQGKLSKAEPYYREALETGRRVLGDEHARTLIFISNMGSLLQDQGKLSEAEPYCREALQTGRRILGDEHRATLTSINNMGSLLSAQGKLSEAEPYGREVLQTSRRVLGDEHPDTLVSINNMGGLLQAQGKLSEAEPYCREALGTAEKLRLDVIGGAQERAQYAERFGLRAIAGRYARLLGELQRAKEALAVLERGRGRAGLDLFGGGRRQAERLLRDQPADSGRLGKYEAALAEEEAARLAVFEAEARMGAAPDTEKAQWLEKVKSARVNLSEKTAAVFNELRGLVPQVDPLTTEEILAELGEGEGLITWAWTGDGATLLVARDGEIQGCTLAKNKVETARLVKALSAFREWIATRPAVGPVDNPIVRNAARDAVVPENTRALLAGLKSLIVIPDGPVQGVPLELLVDNVPIAYAPSATIAINRQQTAEQRSERLAGAIVLGDPVFGGGPQPTEPDYPNTGALLAMVQKGGNAGAAGLERGDVLLEYAGQKLAKPDDLRAAIAAAAQSPQEDQAAKIGVQVWRNGETIEVDLLPGKMGVQLSSAPPAEGLRSMAFMDRSGDSIAAEASALEQIRLYGGHLSPLPGTRLEASAVAAMFGDNATLLLGAESTAPRLSEAIESRPPRVLHLATHGLMGSASRPLLASLALSTPKEPTLQDTGFVTLEDIMSTWGARLKGTELVVLSACDSARGVRQGDTSMSLPLGLFVCGAETVVASLWKVDDRATALLMARFYANWLGKTESEREIDGSKYAPGQPLPKLAALREAQAWLRWLTVAERDRLLGSSAEAIADAATRSDPVRVRGRIAKPSAGKHPYEHPYYWSAFVLYGSPK